MGRGRHYRVLAWVGPLAMGKWRRFVQFGLILEEVGEDLVDGGALSPYEVAKFFQFRGARVDKIDAIVQIVKERKIILQC